MRTLEDSVYRIGEARVSISARTISRAGESFRVRPKNFDLLVFLIQHRGRIATKDEIFREVWPDVAVTENSLVKCVSELRKALGDDLRNPRFLKSVPKVGYELVEAEEEAHTGMSAVVTTLEVQQTTTVALEYCKETSSGAGYWRSPLLAALAVAVVAVSAVAFYGVSSNRKAPVRPPFHWQEIAWWKLNEGRGDTIRDSSASGLDGSLSKGLTWTADGLRFEGYDSTVSGQANGSLPAGDHARTLSAWIKTAVPHVDATAIFSYGNADHVYSSGYFSFGLDDRGSPGFGSREGGSLQGSRRLDDDSWHMVTITYDGPASATGSIYIDGQLERSGKLPAHAATALNQPWKIGGFLAGGTDFRGIVKDVRVFDRALTELQIAATYSCKAGIRDVGDYYYLPVCLPRFVRELRAAGALSTPFRNSNADFAGVQLARSDGTCGVTNVEGADIGQDLRISMDVLTPTDSDGSFTQAGPYFRSRKAAPGDGLLGGTSAGYWVQLQSNGMIRVRRINPLAVVAFSPAIREFDASIFHSLTTEARGNEMRVWLDGKLVQFEQGGRRVHRVEILPAWETPRVGDNQGAAGVAFGAERNRGKIGGQRVKNLSVVSLR